MENDPENRQTPSDTVRRRREDREKDKERNHARKMEMERSWEKKDREKEKFICMVLTKEGQADHNYRSSLLPLS